MFKRLKIRTKLFVLVGIITVVISLIAMISIGKEISTNKKSMNLLEATIRTNYDNNIKEQVDNVISLLEGVYSQYEEGKYTLEEAKEISKTLVRKLSYGKGGYFWVDAVDYTAIILTILMKKLKCRQLLSQVR